MVMKATRGTAINFIASGGTEPLTLTSVAAGAGRQSDEYDRGAGDLDVLYEWRAYVKFATTPVVGETVDIYLKTSDGTHDDNDDGATDAALSAEDKLKNLTYMGSIIVDEASTTPEFSASGQISIYARYIQVVVFNNTADALSSTAADHGVILTPVIPKDDGT
jgi:hypothetical protein